MKMVGSPMGRLRWVGSMDKLYRLIVSSDSCCDNATMVSTLKIKPPLFSEKPRRRAFSVGLFMDFAHQKSDLLTKNYDRFQKGWILFLIVGLFRPMVPRSKQV